MRPSLRTIAGCFLAAAFVSGAAFGQSAGPSASPAFAQGVTDRQAWETWFAGLSGQYRAGAEFWASQRSLPNPAGCFAGGGRNLGDWSQGCIEAQHLLRPSDMKRKADPEYRLGWNSYDPERAEEARQAQLERDRQALQRMQEDAEKATQAQLERDRQVRERMHEEAEKERLTKLASWLEARGFKLVSPLDLWLDWHDLRAAGTQIAIEGTYRTEMDIDYLEVPLKEEPLIRVYTDTASRNARKSLLECRESDFDPAKCRMIVGGTVHLCVRNQGQLNEKEIPCMTAQEVFLVPDDLITSGSDSVTSPRS